MLIRKKELNKSNKELAYPTNAITLLSYEGEDLRKFALTANVQENDREIFISIKPDDLIIVSNENLSNTIFQHIGKKLPTRSQVRSGKYKLENSTYILGVSALLELDYKNLRAMPLLQRDMSAPSNPGKWTAPGGLCGRHPLWSIQEELAQEIGLLEYHKDEDIIKILVPVLEEFQNNEEESKKIITLKNWQEKHIRSHLPSNYKNSNFEYRILKVKNLKMPTNIKKVYLKMPEDSEFEETNFMASFDNSIQGLTLCARFFAVLDDNMNYMIIDPEPFNRNTELVTSSNLKTLQCTTALQTARDNNVCFA